MKKPIKLEIFFRLYQDPAGKDDVAYVYSVGSSPWMITAKDTESHSLHYVYIYIYMVNVLLVHSHWWK